MAPSNEEKTAKGKKNNPISPVQSFTPYEAIPYKIQIIPHKFIALLFFHVLAVYGLVIMYQLKWQTLLFGSFIGLLGGMGVLVGAHRLWAHRTFTANIPLRLFLAFWFTFSFQETVYEWVRDHRGHHKWTDTDADPYNARRGFFFSHIGWIVLKKHPEVIRKGKTIDMSDIESDPILAFQKRWFWPLLVLIWGFLPTFIPAYFWNESVLNALLVCVFLRTVISLNIAWLVNSWAHMYGYRPYDNRITPVEATIRHLLLGEGFHNYHHAFPWDYSASELGPGEVFNPATVFIDFCHYMGWASHLKRADGSLVEKKTNTVSGENLVFKDNIAKEWIGGWLTYFGLANFLPLAISHFIQYALGED